MAAAVQIHDLIDKNEHFHLQSTPCANVWTGAKGSNRITLKIKLSECPIGPGQVQKTQNAMSNYLFALGPYISPMTNVLLTDLGFSIPLSFIDKCMSTFVDSTIY